MEIKLYEDWMKPQVTKLFSSQYGRNLTDVELTMTQFYEHPFQQTRSIRIVALDSDKVVGFQSLYFWPYTMDGKIFNSFQSGNSLVHPEYRGKGIFQKMLKFIDNYNKDLHIDFIIGFPVEQSFKSFIHANWINPFNLIWYVKIINPLAFFFSINSISNSFVKKRTEINSIVASGTFRLSRCESFEQWINCSRDQSPYFFYDFIEKNHKIRFALKINKRNRWFNELIIGDIRTTLHESSFLKRGFKNLIIKAFINFRITGISITLNEYSPGYVFDIIKKLGFIRTNKSIYFIVKSYSNDIPVQNKFNWELYRNDIDTW